MNLKVKYVILVKKKEVANTMTIVFKVSDNIKEMMIKHYSKMNPTKPQYTIFQVKDFDCVTTLYESGKVMFQGIGADIESSFWIEQERIKNNRYIAPKGESKKKEDNKKEKKEFYINTSSVGSDEVGTGDYFGPLVVTASYVPKEKFNFLEELGVKDSKKMTDEKIISIAPTLIKEIIHTTFILDNRSYNEIHNTETNMNKIKAILHNKCLLSVIKKENVEYNKIVVDQFEPEKAYYNHLKDVPEIVKNIFFVTKAEDKCLSVACSSIISRYIFLKEIKKISEKYNTYIPLGASEEVDNVAANLVQKHGKEILKEIVKLSFKNTEKVERILKEKE